VKVVVFGPGRLGCGLVGEALRASGHEVVFVARDRVLAEHLTRLGGYRVRLLDRRTVQDVDVEGIRAVWIAEAEQVRAELAGADLVATCVRAHNLPDVAAIIARGLERRSSPVNVLVFENLPGAGSIFRRMVLSGGDPRSPLDRHGFSGVVVGRAVSQRLGNPEADERLTFVGDPVAQFAVDARALRAPLAPVRGMVVSERFVQAELGKLYTFSTGHAITAYLGHLKGYHYIHTAIRDAEIRAVVTGAITEAQAGLALCYGPEAAGGPGHLRRTVARFENSALDDPVLRVARDPLRKLGPRDRLVGAATLAEEAGISPHNLAVGTAAGLCFADIGDPSSLALQEALRADGVEGVLRSVCGREPLGRFGRRITATWRKLALGRAPDNVLLSLEHSLWSATPVTHGATDLPAGVA
jgi:mannitol-1-phosphate 5-dehydrogenase